MVHHNFLPGTQADLQRTLTEVNRKMQEDESKAKAMALGMPYVDLHNFPIDFNVLALLEEKDAVQLQAVVFFKEQNDIRIGVVNPNLPALQDKILEFSKNHKVTQYIISQKSFEETLNLYKKVIKPKLTQDKILSLNTQTNYQKKIELLKSSANQTSQSASELMEIIFGSALEYKASDIHLEPEAHMIKLRFRVDGVLQDILHIPKEWEKSIVSRIKILSGLKLNITTQAQDGRLTFYLDQKAIDVRVSILPSSFGEELVMRILGSNNQQLSIASLGLSSGNEELLRRILARPNGMIITTGPTGSGKTTTLYSCLNELNTQGVKIITLEDPVEYRLEGIVQTPIDHTHDFDFAKALKAVLRQDPDIVMVGEIRDQETAETAMQSALTGHLVLTTLHTNDASGAIPRLINMGIKPFVMAPALSLVIAQRLVRKICQTCKVKAVLPPHMLEKAMFILKQIPTSAKVILPKEIVFFHSTGCEACGGLGYSGRVGIYEFLENTDNIQALIFKQGSMSEFKQTAQKQGMITMAQDGLLKALAGITDIEEVFRVTVE
jgi:type IV pilus assembly protein PilB